jgi:hypothetical protein
MDGLDNIYVTGQTGTASGATMKYDSHGNQQWVDRNSPRPGDIAVDGSGNVYVTGYTRTGGSPAYLTVKYDSSGNQQWRAPYANPGKDGGATAIALDGSGNAYVTGGSKGLVAGSTTVSDYATVKYDGDGNQLWVARYDGPVAHEDEATDIAVDGTGNVYVTGWTDVKFCQDPYSRHHYQDYATIKYTQ